MVMFYRYYDRDYTEGPFITYSEFPVLRTTPKGVWLNVRGEEKFVLTTGSGHGRRYAYPTKEQALYSYRKRKQRQVQHLGKQYDHAKRCEELAKEITPDMERGRNLACYVPPKPGELLFG